MHLEIVGRLARVEWVAEHWTLQRLFARALDRDRHVRHFDGLASHEDQVRVRGHMGPMSTIPHLTAPNNPARTLSDREYSWIANARLGRKQPCSLGLGKCCTCAKRTLIGNGHHCRVCPRGGGQIEVHNAIRDDIHACLTNAGVVARTEVPNLLPGSGDRPADIKADGIGEGGADIVCDVTVVDHSPRLTEYLARRRSVGRENWDGWPLRQRMRKGPRRVGQTRRRWRSVSQIREWSSDLSDSRCSVGVLPRCATLKKNSVRSRT